ncbi:DnaJ, sub C member 18 [Nowakowskiella sp. JEL0407]|nr:DnaJ, sub C member 18 [Nowakowskiella sp. JEL0407]
MNYEQASKCLSVSKQKYNDGDSQAALRFAKKAVSLDDAKEFKDWLEFVTKHSSASSNPSSSSNPPAASSSTDSPAPERTYTPEQLSGVKRIKECKAKGDLYAILSLEKSCSDADIKKAYRKLALQFHPDKCAAPGTDEAFKAIGHAMAVLSDPDKREKYDRYGIDSESRASSSNTTSPFNRGFAGDFENEISPEELFNMFFGEMANGATFTTGGPGFRFHTVNPRFRRAHQQQGREQPATPIAQLVQLLPLFLLMLITVLSWFQSDPDPIFKFSAVPPYTIQRHTQRNQVKYFVSNRFNIQNYQNNPSKLRNFENSIESHWLSVLEEKCLQEQQYRAMQIQSARGIFKTDEKKLKEAKAIRMYTCEERKEFLEKASRNNRFY